MSSLEMDSDYLITDLDCIIVNGITFTTEERAILHNSLTLLKEDGRFRKVYFWGKLIGLVKNYFIAYGLHRDILRQRQTFYSLDMKKWNLMSPPSPEHKAISKYIRRPLLGDPAHEETVKIPIYSVKMKKEADAAEEETEADEESDEDFDEEEDNAESKGKRSKSEKDQDLLESGDNVELDETEKIITDEEHLASIVYQIDHDSALAPRGAYVRTPIGEVLNNRFFTGLDLTEATKPQNYMHIRFPKAGTPRKSRANDSDVARTIDFLDPISDDDPKGCWSIQIDSTRDVAILRNLWWPGMVFYHRVCSKDFGSIYVGYGDKNSDLPFML